MKAILNQTRISPKKANLIAGIVRGQTVEKALPFLNLADKKGAGIIHKLVASAVANAKNNEGKSGDNLVIDHILVTKGRTMRRGVPASRGRVAPIKKRSSNITVILKEVIPEPKTNKKVTGKEEAVATETKKAPAKTTAAKKPAAKKPAAKKAA